MTISSSSSAPLIAVVGATGQQGGSVVEHLSRSSKEYRVRGFTRDASKPVAKELEKKGVEVVAVDLDDKDATVKAFEGAEVVFGVTNFWAHASKSKELEQGKIQADAAKAVGAKLFIWSGLHDANKASKGQYVHVDHFDGKADIRDYADSIGLNVLDVQAACYLQNFTGFLKPQKVGEDEFAYFLPIKEGTPVHFIDISHDYGNFVVSALETPESERPKTVNTASAEVAPEVLVAEIAKIAAASNKKVKYQYVSGEQFTAALKGAGLPDALAVELSEMWQFLGTHGYYGGDKTTQLKLLHPTRTVQEFFALPDIKKEVAGLF